MSPPSALLLLLGAAFMLVGANYEPDNATKLDCGPDKQYNKCGTSCPANCTHPNGVPCNRKCNPGCFCKVGYVELGELCVEKKKCESCAGNTTYTECGTACPTTCSSRPDEPIRCTSQCVMGCECKPGYVLLDDTEKRCVLPEDCPPEDEIL